MYVLEVSIKVHQHYMTFPHQDQADKKENEVLKLMCSQKFKFTVEKYLSESLKLN